MYTEFHQVPLDRVRYGLVWESYADLAAALQPTAHDEVLVVTSAGCNALNLLLSPARRVVALDLNPVQNALLELKVYLIRHFGPEVLRALLGLDGPAAVQQTWARTAPLLPPALCAYWDAQLARFPRGLLALGQLEHYLLDFVPSLPEAMHYHLRALLHCPTIADQHHYFETHLHGSAFQQAFETYFDAVNLSRGRDPRLFRYAAESGGTAFYARLRHQLATELVAQNFYFRFFFFGPEHLPESLLPPCYQRRHHAELRRRLPQLEAHTGEAVAYLLSAAGRRITKASLSNIFEYVSPTEFGATLQALANRGGLELVYWNLLNGQNAAATIPHQQLRPGPAGPGHCFYLPDMRHLVLPAPTCPTPTDVTFSPCIVDLP